MATKKSSLLNQLKLEGYIERAMKNCFSSLGRSESGHVMLSPFFQPRYSTVLNEKSNNLLPTFSRCAAISYYTLYSVREMGITRLLCYSSVSQKRDFFSALNFIVLNLMYQALTSAQNRYEKRTRCYITKPDQLYPRAFSLRPNRVLFVFTIFKGFIGEKMLALRLRTLAT